MTTQEQAISLPSASELASSIQVEVSDRPLPARMRLAGARQHAVATAQAARPRRPSLPAVNPVIPIAGASALTMLVVRGRRRP